MMNCEIIDFWTILIFEVEQNLKKIKDEMVKVF